MENLAEDSFLEKTTSHLSNITTFLQKYARETDKTDREANIINRAKALYYVIPQAFLNQFYTLLYSAARAKIPLEYATIQKPISAVVVEFIIKHQSPISRSCYMISRAAEEVGKIAAQLFEKHKHTEIHIAISKRRSAVPTDKPGEYEDWIRFIIPNIHLNRANKEFVLSEIYRLNIIDIVFQRELYGDDRVNSIELHDHCTIAPVYFVGSGGKNPYDFVATYRFDLDSYRVNDRADLPDDYNPVQLCSTLVENPVLLDRPVIASSDQKIDGGVNAANGGGVDDADADIDGVLDGKLEFEGKIRMINESHVESDLYHIMNALKILDFKKNSREEWLEIIESLANSGNDYYVLAQWFTCGTEFARELETVWKACLNRSVWNCDINSTNSHIMNFGPDKRHIIHEARECDPKEFFDLTRSLISAKIFHFAMKFDGHIEPGMISTLLYMLKCDKYVVDFSTTIKGTLDYVWYEFVDDPRAPAGQLFKWRKEYIPDEMILFLRRDVQALFSELMVELERRVNEEEDKNIKFRLKGTVKCFRSSTGRLYNDKFARGIIDSAQQDFRIRGFANTLDKHPGLFGVKNGVLVLTDGIPRLVTGYHHFRITQSSPTEYCPINWDDPATKLIWGAICDIIVEEDAREYIMCYISTSITRETKAALMLMLEGGGANGKSWLMEMIVATLGSIYAKKIPMSLFTGKRETSDRANSAYMMLKEATVAYISETEKSETLNTATFKEVTGQETQSVRDLNSKQENFKISANIIQLSNWPTIVESTDHGTWRRIRKYKCKTSFKETPNPNNRFEKQMNKEFITRHVNDPKMHMVFLGILVHFYNIFKIKYGGDLDNIPHNTIKRETEMYRDSQDKFNCFINKFVIEVEDKDMILTLDMMAERFILWCNVTNARAQYTVSVIIKQFELTKLESKFVRLDDGTVCLRGYRLRTDVEVQDRTLSLLKSTPVVPLVV